MENFKNKKDKALWSAASDGNLKNVQKALADGADVNGTNYLNMTALHAVLDADYLAENVQLEIVKTLLDAGADTEIISELGQNPLKLAVAGGKFEIVKLLNEKGADIFVESYEGDNLIYEAIDKFDTLPGYIKIIKYLIEKGVNIEAKKVESGQTALYRAADLGFPETVEALIKGKAQVNLKDEWGLSPLHYAARGGHIEIVKLLIEAGADVNAQEDYGFTPLHEAAENGRLETAKYLIEKNADANKGLKSGFDAYEAGDKPVDIAKKALQSDVADFLEKI